ncbi:MAG: D-Ala-D-Ala carboxypeptidase family metallohydrolase [Syntrophomonadaceae bacterium]
MNSLLHKYSITDFSAGELFRKCTPPASLYENVIPSLCIIQKIRSAISVPIVIHSAYRDPLYNARVHGAKCSLHLEFNALDFSPLSFTPLQIRNLCLDIALGKFNLEMDLKDHHIFVNPGVMGLGLYPTFIHLDTRGLLGRKAPRRWEVKCLIPD